MILVYLGRWSYGRFQDDNNNFYMMKNALTTGTWQDDIWCPIIIILFCTSGEGPGQETPCEKSQHWRGPNNSHYCQKHYNQSLQHQQGKEQPQSTNPVDGHIIISESSSIWQDELHLNQATAQPHSKKPSQCNNRQWWYHCQYICQHFEWRIDCSPSNHTTM